MRACATNDVPNTQTERLCVIAHGLNGLRKTCERTNVITCDSERSFFSAHSRAHSVAHVKTIYLVAEQILWQIVRAPVKSIKRIRFAPINICVRVTALSQQVIDKLCYRWRQIDASSSIVCADLSNARFDHSEMRPIITNPPSDNKFNVTVAHVYNNNIANIISIARGSNAQVCVLMLFFSVLLVVVVDVAVRPYEILNHIIHMNKHTAQSRTHTHSHTYGYCHFHLRATIPGHTHTHIVVLHTSTYMHTHAHTCWCMFG